MLSLPRWHSAGVDPSFDSSQIEAHDRDRLSFSSLVPASRIGCCNATSHGAWVQALLSVAKDFRDKRTLNHGGLIWKSGSGVRVLAFGPAVSRGVHNGLGPGRARHPDRSRHDETALGGIESDDVAAQGAQTCDDRPRRRTSDPEFRADQEPCGTVGRTACTNRIDAFKTRHFSRQRTGPAAR
jgi:hypothetical protein